MAKIETLSLEVDGILPDTQVFRERCFLLDGAALYSFKAAPALVPQGRINLHDAQLALREEERAFFITVLAESRIYRLVAESLAESADWAHALRLARCTQGALGLLALTGHGDGVRRLPFRTSGGVTLGDGAASVVLPTALLQARLTGADGALSLIHI